eukprot:gene11358-biopygen35468
MSHLTHNVDAAAGGPLPPAIVEACDAAWERARPTSEGALFRARSSDACRVPLPFAARSRSSGAASPPPPRSLPRLRASRIGVSPPRHDAACPLCAGSALPRRAPPPPRAAPPRRAGSWPRVACPARRHLQWPSGNPICPVLARAARRAVCASHVRDAGGAGAARGPAAVRMGPRAPRACRAGRRRARGAVCEGRDVRDAM